MNEPVQWVVSADELEKRILSGEWTKMTDLEIDQFLATPELSEVDTNGSLQDQEGDVPELVEEMEGGELNIENVDNIEGLEDDPNSSSINNDN